MKGTAEWMETFASIEFRPFDDYEWEVYAGAECPEHGTVELEPIIGEAETVVLGFSVNVVEVCADANGIQVYFYPDSANEANTFVLELPYPLSFVVARGLPRSLTPMFLLKCGFEKI